MLLLDGRPLQGDSAVRGIGSYERGLLAGFVELGRAWDVALLLAARRAAPREVAELGLRVAPPRLPTIHPTLQPVADPLFVAAALRRVRPAVYHAVEWGQPLRATVPVVVTVHDLIPFVFPAEYPWVRRARIPALRLLRRADRVITPSRATERDVIRLARVRPERISVIAEGIAPGFAPAADSAVDAMRRRLGLTRPYVLAVGTHDPRKRIGVLAEVCARIRRGHDVDLVIAGDQGTFDASVRAALTTAGVAANTHLTGLVSGETLAALYTGAACLLFTSAYEGFGLPPLEAMACGAPAVLFANSSLPEVAGPATVVEPDGDAAAMADAACALLDDPGAAALQIAAGREWAARFTWREAASRTLAVYDAAMRARAGA